MMKTKRFAFGIAALLWCVSLRTAQAVSATPQELAEAKRWSAARFDGAERFFSFTYDGKPSSELLGGWELKRSTRELNSQRIEHTLTYSDPETGLVVRCVGIEYRDFPATEWVLFFKNTGPRDTPVIEKIQALDALLPHAAGAGLIVHHARGSDSAHSDFAPLADTLAPGAELKLHSHGPRGGNRGGGPSIESLPFFNLQLGDRGVFVGLGWTGPWAASFARDATGTLRAQAGLERTHLLLHPGEEIRSPRILTLFWQGDRLRAHNLWRRLLLKHYSPRSGGKPFAGLLADGNWGSWMNAERHIEEINFWGDHNLPMECYWVDAGWTDMSLGWEAHQSHQVPNPTLFPQGMRPLADAAHRRGMKFLLWMVPESVHPAVGIGKEHPEWLGQPFGPPWYGKMVFHGLDHGNPQVNQFMIGHFSKVVSDFGVDIFRQDGCNLWPEDTDPKRAGMSQIQYIQGFYAFWDGLLKRHPHLLIDNCAEGGRKIDLETIRRSIALWRSDCQARMDFDPVVNQGFNYGLLQWIPLCGAVTPLNKLSAYSFRSAYCPALLMGWPMARVSNIKHRWSKVDLDLLRKLLKEYLAVRPYLFGDFYPLMPYSRDQDKWIAWQFDVPEQGEGMVQAFRRSQSIYEIARFKLRGLESGTSYVLTNLDTGESQTLAGRELLDKGLAVPITEQPGSAVIVYKKAK
ncbi:MAG: alpha-galactosidase [Verrucomicrobia bacterium]|nr:alpha-galactosidase [Verrucomicrobiota bacterium]